jgi:hypothetical protein
VLARTKLQGTMGHGESQIGYLANKINLYGVRAHGCVDTTIVEQ